MILPEVRNNVEIIPFKKITTKFARGKSKIEKYHLVLMLFFVLIPTITNPLQVKNDCFLFMAAINNEKEIFVK